MPNTQITSEVVKSVGVIAQNKSGWQREVNIIKWNEGKAKLDIRDWGPDYAVCLRLRKAKIQVEL